MDTPILLLLVLQILGLFYIQILGNFPIDLPSVNLQRISRDVTHVFHTNLGVLVYVLLRSIQSDWIYRQTLLHV